ncbi:hypothetical protein [Angustibacter aerolatus]|uniref:Uncharacterized protein n=1 Tax=Angustibacter aerolatus TaxID=1162965 RepID=A0ABQ6JJR5_9ACTN|nr:hypothetical protein [Angustibacter aerolatus]GMA88482.1 hypothetical protein GCM10025868_37320 [Angustibacter aerolatus]
MQEQGRVEVEQVLVAPCPAGSMAAVRLRTASGTSTGVAEGSEASWAVVTATARAVEDAVGTCPRLDAVAVDLLGVGGSTVAVVVLTLLSESGVDRLTGSSVVDRDTREGAYDALVRATFDAFDRAAAPGDAPVG